MKLSNRHAFAFAAISMLTPVSATADDLEFNFSNSTSIATAAFDMVSGSAPRFQPHLWMQAQDEINSNKINNLVHGQPELFVGLVNQIGDLNIGAIARTLRTTPIEDLALNLDSTQDEIEQFITDFNRAFDHRQKRNNCYSYAVNDLHGQDHYAGGLPFPGENTIYDGLDIPRIAPLSLQYNVIEGATADGLSPAGKTLPIIQDGHYRVALMIDDDEDFHWVREDENGLWSGKWGHQDVHTTDYNDNPITNPDTADFGPYEVVQYFYVPEGGINLQKDITPPYRPGSPFEWNR
jgi:hypothetical protein